MNNIAVTEIVDDNAHLSFIELSNCAHVERHYIIEMVEAGLLEPHGAAIDEWQFANRDVRRLRSAQRLMNDLGVNPAGAAIILDLIEERDSLLKRVQLLNEMMRDA